MDIYALAATDPDWRATDIGKAFQDLVVDDREEKQPWDVNQVKLPPELEHRVHSKKIHLEVLTCSLRWDYMRDWHFTQRRRLHLNFQAVSDICSQRSVYEEAKISCYLNTFELMEVQQKGPDVVEKSIAGLIERIEKVQSMEECVEVVEQYYEEAMERRLIIDPTAVPDWPERSRVVLEQVAQLLTSQCAAHPIEPGAKEVRNMFAEICRLANVPSGKGKVNQAKAKKDTWIADIILAIRPKADVLRKDLRMVVTNGLAKLRGGTTGGEREAAETSRKEAEPVEQQREDGSKAAKTGSGNDKEAREKAGGRKPLATAEQQQHAAPKNPEDDEDLEPSTHDASPSVQPSAEKPMDSPDYLRRVIIKSTTLARQELLQTMNATEDDDLYDEIQSMIKEHKVLHMALATLSMLNHDKAEAWIMHVELTLRFASLLAFMQTALQWVALLDTKSFLEWIRSRDRYARVLEPIPEVWNGQAPGLMSL